MRKKTLLIITICTLVFLIFVAASFDYYLKDKQKKRDLELQKKKQSLIEDIYKSPDVNIIQEEFNVSYLQDDDTFVITIKKDPFEENRQKALQWLRDKGFDLSKIKYTCLSAKGVNVSDTDLEKCNKEGKQE